MIIENDHEILFINSKCNQFCVFCYGNKFRNNYEPELAYIFSQIDSFSENGARKIIIEGGEPSISPHLVRTIRYILSKGMSANLLTNGRVFADKRNCAIIKKAGIERLTISIHGLDGIHDRLVGVNGAFLEVVEAVKNFTRLNLPVSINIVLTKQNLSDIKNLYDSFSKINPGIIFNLYYPTLINHTGLAFSVMETLKIIKPIIHNKNVVLIGFPLCFIPSKTNFLLTRYFDLAKFFNEKCGSGDLRTDEYEQYCAKCSYFFNCSKLQKRHVMFFDEHPKHTLIDFEDRMRSK